MYLKSGDMKCKIVELDKPEEIMFEFARNSIKAVRVEIICPPQVSEGSIISKVERCIYLKCIVVMREVTRKLLME